MKKFYPFLMAMLGLAITLSGANTPLNNEEFTDFTFTGAAGSNWTDEGSWTPSYPGTTVAAGNTITITTIVLVNTPVEVSSDVVANAELRVLNGQRYTQRAGTLTLNAPLSQGDIFSDAGALLVVNGQWRIGPGNSVLDGDLRLGDAGDVLPFNSNRTLTINGNLSGTGRVLGITATAAVILNGEINPGNDGPGCINVTVDANNNATLTNLEVNGATPCSEHDQITTNNAGDYYPTGTLNVTVGYEPADGDQIVLVQTNASIVGEYETVNLPDNWEIAYNAPNEGQITITYTDICAGVSVGEVADVVIEVGGPEVPLTITTTPTGAGPFTYLFELAGAAVGLLLPTEVAGVDPADPSTYPAANPDNLSQFFKDRGFGNTFYNVRVIDANGCESDDFYRVRVDFITDPDDDGVGNHEDNCPETFNSDQADSDEDGTGDVCDDTPNGEIESQEVVWQMHHGQGEGIFVPGEGQPSVRDILTELYGPFSPQHGDAGGYQYASIPAADDPVWEAAPVDPEDGQLCFRLDRSRLDGIMMALDFTYFQTSITVSDTTLPFIIRYMAVDDGVRAYVFNSRYPEGAFLPDGPDDDPMPDGDARLYHTPKEADLSSLLVEGENRIVLVQFDNAATENYLKVVVPPYGEADPCSDDTEAPLMDLSGIVLDTLECVSPEEAPAPVEVLATDDCDPEPSVEVEVVATLLNDTTIIESEDFPAPRILIEELGTQINWIYTATDASGNVSVDTVEAYFLAADNESPEITSCPTDTVMIELDTAGQVLTPVAELGISAMDNCTPPEELTVNTTLLDFEPDRFLSVNFTDASGNTSAQCLVAFTTEPEADPCDIDTEAPLPYFIYLPINDSIALVEDTTIYNICVFGIGDGGLAVVDNCDPSPSVGSDLLSSDNLPDGRLQEIYSIQATDESGNAANKTLIILRGDREPPVVLECPSENLYYVEVDTGYNPISGQEVILQDIVGEDNCSEAASLTLDFEIGIIDLEGEPSDSITINAMVYLVDEQGNRSEEGCPVRLRTVDPNSSPAIVGQGTPGDDPLEVSISPNPIRDLSTLTVNVSENSRVTVEIRDLNGQVMSTAQFDALKDVKNEFNLQSNDLRSGMYFITIRTATEQKTIRALIIE